MAQACQTGDIAMSAHSTISDLLAAPLPSDWTIESIAECLLRTLSDQPSANGAGEAEFVFDKHKTVDRQTSRLIRPLLACLAMKSAAENNSPVNLYGGQLHFRRQGLRGPSCIVGEFENRPESTRLSLRRLDTISETCNHDIARTRVLHS
jgi:hypothetical protein